MVVASNLMLLVALLPGAASLVQHGHLLAKTGRARHSQPVALSQADKVKGLEDEILRLREQLQQAEATAQPATSAQSLPSIESLSDSLSSLLQKVQGLPSDLASTMSTAVKAPPELADVLAQLSAPQLRAPLPSDLSLLLSDVTPAAVAFQLGALALVGLGSAISSADDKGEAPYQPGTNSYNPEVADAFFRERPLLVAKRLLTLARLTSAFTTGVLWDWLVLGKLLKDEEYTALKRAEPRRAKEALALCEQLGPTFIKLGQVRGGRELPSSDETKQTHQCGCGSVARARHA